MGAIAATAKNLWGRRHYFRPRSQKLRGDATFFRPTAKNLWGDAIFPAHSQISVGATPLFGCGDSVAATPLSPHSQISVGATPLFGCGDSVRATPLFSPHS